MSYIFDVGDETVWSPALRVGRSYVALAEATAAVLGKATGLEAISEDMYDITPSVFADFTRTLLAEYELSKHFVGRQLLHGVLLTSLVIVQRSGIEIVPETEEQEKLWISIPEFSKSMPT
ncbi:DUF6086 family protein [Actinomadura fulvescens]|uniref:DUF6086 family protein n=1 Tax=Actinomadura fulvescens TaxID=46160 RepID=UPI0031DBB099